jgi:hypothetical protein
MMTARKIVSSLGMTEICPVRLSGGDTIEPLPSFAEIGLRAAVDADGFVIVSNRTASPGPNRRVVPPPITTSIWPPERDFAAFTGTPGGMPMAFVRCYTGTDGSVTL